MKFNRKSKKQGTFREISRHLRVKIYLREERRNARKSIRAGNHIRQITHLFKNRW